jgi:hypothetical protein
MLFNLEADMGDRVSGYIVPDGFSGVPAISVCSNGRELLVFHANEVRHALVAAGRHESGNCGFTLDTAMLPELPNLQQLELFDVETGLLIYRRPLPQAIRRKILRLETHLFPLWRLDQSLEHRFQYFAKGIDQLGRETVTQLFLLDHVESVFLSGRILYKNYGYFIEAGFETVALLHDPYEELAERLLVLSKIRKAGSGLLGERDSIRMHAAIEFAETLPIGDEKALRRAIRNMPAEVAATLTNPLTRLLTTTTPDEMPARGAVALALDLLSSFSLVGLRQNPETFIAAFSELLGIEASSLSIVSRFGSTETLVKMLKTMPEVEILLEKDLELYHYIVDAFQKSA